MKNLLRSSYLVAFLCILSSFTITHPHKEKNRFPIGTTVGYITANSPTLTGSFRVVADINDHSTIIYMVSTVTNGYYLVTGTRDAVTNFASIRYQNAPVFDGILGATPGTVPPGTGGGGGVE